MRFFIGILDGAKKTWGVRIPDLPGCYGGGKNADEALTDAISAAREWAEHRSVKGGFLPAPSTIDKIRDQMAPREIAVPIPLFYSKRLKICGDNSRGCRPAPAFRGLSSGS